MAPTPVFDSSGHSPKAGAFVSKSRYYGVWYKKEMPPNDGNNPFHWIQQSVTPSDIQVQHSPNRVGNKDGFDLLDMYEVKEDRIKNLENEVSKTKDLIKTLQKASEEKTNALEKAFEEKSKTLGETQGTLGETRKTLGEVQKTLGETQQEVSRLTNAHITLRRGVLEERRIVALGKGSHKDRTTTRARNDVAHGGDILGDVKAIQYVTERGLIHASEYMTDFPHAYGISFWHAVANLPRYPPEVIRAFDLRASVHELKGWQKPAASANREVIENLATQIIEAASSTAVDHLHARFKSGGDLQQVFNQMNATYMAGY